GVGATTEIEYSTVQHLDLAATKAGQPWTSHSPVVLAVVTQVTVRDTPLTSANPNSNAAQPFRLARVVEYGYRDPAWDPWQRRSVGFRKTRVRFGIGQSSVTETTRWFAGCQRDVAACPNSEAEQALTGAPVRIDRFTATGLDGKPDSWLSSRFLFHSAVQLFPGVDGGSWYAFAEREDTHVYEPTNPVQLGPVHSTLGDPIETSPLQAERVKTSRITEI